jgi:diguanylate cyclase (GGDEF)-like protein
LRPDSAGGTPPDERYRPSRPTGWVASVLEPPDPTLAHAGAAGEVVVAQTRLALILILFLIPIVQLVLTRGSAEVWVGLTISSVSLGVAIVLLVLVRQGEYRPWIGFFTSALDVTFITSVLVIFLVDDQPLIAVNSRVVYPIYLLAIASTTLRYDPRICAMTGLLAVLQYGGVVWYAASHWSLSANGGPPSPYGAFDWNSQIARLILLACGGVLSTMVVERARRLRWLAASDPLTGMMNRGFFDERLEEESLRARRYERPLSILMIDMDHFKQFNDTHGHGAGDAALRLASDAIHATLRRTDLLGRYGGEEFVVAMPETTVAAAATKAEHLRATIAGATIALPRGTVGAVVTVSIGVAVWPDDGGDARAVLDVADRRLYQAKQAGRNRVVGPGGPVAP